MKMILFLAAVYALIIHQSQNKKKQIPPPLQGVSYSQSVLPDTTIKKAPATPSVYFANYLNTQTSAIIHAAAK